MERTTKHENVKLLNIKIYRVKFIVFIFQKNEKSLIYC